MAYKQITLQNATNWSKEKLDKELEKGYADILAGRTKPAALYLSEAKKNTSYDF